MEIQYVGSAYKQLSHPYQPYFHSSLLRSCSFYLNRGKVNALHLEKKTVVQKECWLVGPWWTCRKQLPLCNEPLWRAKGDSESSCSGLLWAICFCTPKSLVPLRRTTDHFSVTSTLYWVAGLRYLISINSIQHWSDTEKNSSCQKNTQYFSYFVFHVESSHTPSAGLIQCSHSFGTSVSSQLKAN